MPCHPRHSRETHRPGCSRCVLPCQCTAATPRQSACLSSENLSHRRSEQHPGCSTLSARNCEADPAPHLHPNEHGPTDTAYRKATPLRPTPPTASRFSAHSRSAGLVNTPDCAHEALSAQTNLQSGHAPATTHASVQTVASPWQRTEK